MSYDNWYCPSCGTWNTAFNAWCPSCAAPPPGAAPGPRQQLPGSSLEHPGRAGFNPLDPNAGAPMMSGPTDQWQYYKDGGQLVWRPYRGANTIIGNGANQVPVVTAAQFGPFTETGNSESVVSYRAQIVTPQFDLRPGLRDSAGEGGANTYPIWRGMAEGAGAQLAIQVIVDQRFASVAQVLNVWSAERVSLWKPDETYMTGTPTSLTQSFLDGWTTVSSQAIGGGSADGWAYTTTLLFNPPSNPVRYWQVFVSFDIMPRAVDDEENGWEVQDPVSTALPAARYSVTVQ